MKYQTILLLLFVVLLLGAGCKKALSPRAKYYVDGTSTTYTVIYMDADGKEVTLDTVPYGWSTAFESEKGAPLMISATAHQNDSWAKVYVYIDGKLLDSDYRFGDKETARIETILKLIF